MTEEGGEGRRKTDSEVIDDVLERAAVPLAAVVEKERTETATESLRAEGVYDESRSVRQDGPERTALPVTAPPTDTRVLEVLRQVDPEYRNRDLEDLLADRGWDETDLETAPGSWAVIGSVILVTVPENCVDEADVAGALLELHGEADSVLADEGIANDGAAGTHREPRTRLLAGGPSTETIHTEHGTRYGLDPATVMFSPGNQAERTRMGEVVSAGQSATDESSGSPRDADEHVFDMFAGIGYFTLPMARAGARVTATELNPTAFRYLLENAVLNDVADRVDAYMTDCRTLADEIDADRVVMGYYGQADGAAVAEGESHGTRTDEAHEFLDDALEALVPGGVVHYHEATPESLLWERPLGRLGRAAERAGRDLDVLEKRRVKSHSAGVAHIVVDAQFEG
jgi:tRNA wybutosine-synthesizing protein 2